MTAFSKTITNSLIVFGPAPSDKWNAYNWNAFTWGEGTAPLEKGPFKVLSESVTPSDVFTKAQARVIDNTLSPTSDMSLENLRDSAGYYHVFPGGVTDGLDRVASTWADGSAGSASWVSSAPTSTVWS